MTSMTASFENKEPRLKRFMSNSSLLKDIPPLSEETEMH